VRERTGLLCFGADDDRALASVVLELLRQTGADRSFAESDAPVGPRCCPGRVAGPPMFFLAALIFLYSNRIKQELMEVPAGTFGGILGSC